MKNTCQHRILFLSTLAVLLGVVCANPAGMAQTPAGTKIRNEARGTFLYRSGESDSVRSNRTETVTLQPLVVASSISLVATPQALFGNGQDTSWLSATVLDAGGNLVPDGTRVFFITSRGSFPGGADSTTILTRNGVATVPLCSDVVTQESEVAEVAATTNGINKTTLAAVAQVLFYPGAIQGTVISALDGHRVQGAVVFIHDASNNEVGRDTTTGAGAYVIPVRGSGLFTRTITYVNRFGDQIQTTASFSMTAPAPGETPSAMFLNAIAGAVVDRSTAWPIRQSGIEVSIDRADASKPNVGRVLPATVNTDDRGTFVFDSLAPGTYRIRVLHSQYAGSLVVQDLLPNSFTVEANISAVESASFELVKSANKRIAEIGDAITYSIDLRNTSLTSPIANVRIIDDLPVGFVYAARSSRLDRKMLDEPSGTRKLVWNLLDTLLAGKVMRLSYTVTIGAGALDGHGINRASGVGQTLAGDTVRSTESSVQVLVHPGVFTDRGVVIGKVFFDRNENGTQEAGELGIAGAELWMEDGTHIVTGDDGKYSLPEVQSGQHVIRVDQKTLPAGSQLLAIGTEFAGDGSSRFIRLVDGGIARADFHVAPPRQAALDAKLVRLPVPPSEHALVATYTIRWNESISATSVILVDTLTEGFHFDLQSVVGSDSCATGRPGASRTLRLDLRPQPKSTVDSIRIGVRPDSALVGAAVAVNPRLVLSYPKRRDAVIEPGEAATPIPVSSTSLQEPGEDVVHTEAKDPGVENQHTAIENLLPLLEIASGGQAGSPGVDSQRVAGPAASMAVPEVAVHAEMKAESDVAVPPPSLRMDQPATPAVSLETRKALHPEEVVGSRENASTEMEPKQRTEAIPASARSHPPSGTSEKAEKKKRANTREVEVRKPASAVVGEYSGSGESGRVNPAIAEVIIAAMGFSIIAARRKMHRPMNGKSSQKG